MWDKLWRGKERWGLYTQTGSGYYSILLNYRAKNFVGVLVKWIEGGMEPEIDNLYDMFIGICNDLYVFTYNNWPPLGAMVKFYFPMQGLSSQNIWATFQKEIPK